MPVGTWWRLLTDGGCPVTSSKLAAGKPACDARAVVQPRLRNPTPASALPLRAGGLHPPGTGGLSPEPPLPREAVFFN